MSLYTRAVEAATGSANADIGFSLKRGLRRTGRIAKRVGKVAVLTAVPPAGAAYLAHKAIKKRRAKNQQKRNRGTSAQSFASDDPSSFAEDDTDNDTEDENENNAAESSSDNDDSDAETGDQMQDEIGWDEIGDDVDAMLAGDEMVGSAPQRRLAGRPGPNAGLVRSRGYSKNREYPLGFSSSGTIAAAASATITAQPQTLFRPKRLVIPSSIAGSFTIQDIKIGNSSQLVAAGSIPGALYSELAVGTMQRYDTAAPGILISLSITNTSAGALAFSAAMVGDSIQ